MKIRIALLTIIAACGLVIAQTHDPRAGYSAPGGGGGAGDVTSGGNTNFTGDNLYLYDTSDSTTVRTGNAFALAVSAYDGLGGAGNGNHDYPFQFWAYTPSTRPQVAINAQGELQLGAAIVLSNDFVGTLGTNMKNIGPFETSTGTDVLGGVAVTMQHIRGDILSAMLQIGCFPSAGSGWGANAYNELGGIHGAGVPANSRAYYAVSGNGGMAWSYSGITPANLHDGLGVGAAVGNARPISHWADFGLVPGSQSQLNLEAITGTGGAANLNLANGGLTQVGGSVNTSLSNITPAAILNIGTAGATTYTYGVTAATAVGETVTGSGATTTTGHATLDGTNYNEIRWTGQAGAQSYNIYRKAGGATQGIIDAVPANLSASQYNEASSSDWVAATVYATGAYRRPTVLKRNGRVYEATTGGTSHATTEPTWPTTIGNTVADNTVTWTCRQGRGQTVTYFTRDTGLVGGSETDRTTGNGYKNNTAGIKIDSTYLSYRGSAGLLGLQQSDTQGGALDLMEFNGSTDAAAPPANCARLYARDNGAGKTQLVVRFATGAVQVLATEP